MKHLLLSISVLWLGAHYCSGHSKIDLKNSSEVVYKVHEDKDGTLTISSQNLKKSSLVDIIYLPIVEKPSGSTLVSNKELSSTEVPDSDESHRPFTNGHGFQFLPPGDDDPNRQVDEGVLLDVRNSSQEDPSPLAPDSNSGKDAPEETTDAPVDEAVDQGVKNPPSKRRKREISGKDERYPPPPPTLSKFHPHKLPKYIQKLLSGSTLKPGTSPDSTTILPKKKGDSSGYLSNGNVAGGAKVNKNVRPKKNVDRTYGINLKGNGGTVWNNLVNPHSSFHVGVDDDSNKDIHGNNSDSNESNSSNSIFGSWNSGLGSVESPEKSGSNSGESGQSGSAEDTSNAGISSDKNHNGSQENGSGINSGLSGDVSGSVGDSNGGSNKGNSGPVENIGGLVENHSGSGESNAVSNESNSGSGENNSGSGESSSDSTEDNSGSRENRSSGEDNSRSGESNSGSGEYNSGSGEYNSGSGVVGQNGDPNNPNTINFLEGMFTKIIKNNIVINNNVPVGSNGAVDITHEKEKIPDTDKPDVNQVVPVPQPTTDSNIDNPTVTDSSDIEVITKATEGPKEGNNSQEITKSSNESNSEEIAPKKDGKENPTEDLTPSPVESHDNKGSGEENHKSGEPSETEKPVKNGGEKGHEEKESQEKFCGKKGHEQKNSEEKDYRGCRENVNGESVEVNTEKSKDVKESPTKEPKEQNCTVQNNKDGNSEVALNTKLDYMLELIKNHTTKFIKEEVVAQVNKYFLEHKQEFEIQIPVYAEKYPAKGNITQENKPDKPDVNGKDDVKEPTNKEKDVKKPSQDITEKPDTKIDVPKKDKKYTPKQGAVHVNANTILGNTVANDKVTNIYIFYASKNIHKIMKNVKNILNGSNSTNIFIFEQHKQKHSDVGIDKKKDTTEKTPTVNDKSDLTVTEPSKIYNGDVTEETNTSTDSTTESNSHSITAPTIEQSTPNDNDKENDKSSTDHSTELNASGKNNTNLPAIIKPVPNNHDDSTTESSTDLTPSRDNIGPSEVTEGVTDKRTEGSDKITVTEDTTASEEVTESNIPTGVGKDEGTTVSEDVTKPSITTEKGGNDEAITVSADVTKPNEPVTESNVPSGETGNNEGTTASEIVTEPNKPVVAEEGENDKSTTVSEDVTKPNETKGGTSNKEGTTASEDVTEPNGPMTKPNESVEGTSNNKGTTESEVVTEPNEPMTEPNKSVEGTSNDKGSTASEVVTKPNKPVSESNIPTVTESGKDKDTTGSKVIKPSVPAKTEGGNNESNASKGKSGENTKASNEKTGEKTDNSNKKPTGNINASKEKSG